MPLTEDDAAFAAWHWASGAKLQDIGYWFGHSKSYISLSISEFIKGHSDARTDGFGRLLDNEMPRRQLAAIVSKNFYKYREIRKIRIRVKARGEPC